MVIPYNWRKWPTCLFPLPHAAAALFIPPQVVDTFHNWRKRSADLFYNGDIEQCMAETGTGGAKLLILALMDAEYARPGGWGWGWWGGRECEQPGECGACEWAGSRHGHVGGGGQG